jgi:hypothetical protein
MLEGKLPGAGHVQAFDPLAGGPDRLRPVSWSDLVAKFDAVRELRAALGSGEAGGDASFDPDSARHIAELAESKHDINFDDLANGKGAGDMDRVYPDRAGREAPRK